MAGPTVFFSCMFSPWFVDEVVGILWPFFISFVLAYLLAPLMNLLGRRISRTLAIALIALLNWPLTWIGDVTGMSALLGKPTDMATLLG